MNIQRRVYVSGRVQGVSFRASTFREVQKFPHLKGYVRNLEDGRVEAVFSGSEEDVLAMVAWCKTGPALAEVTDLEVREEKIDGKLVKFFIDSSSGH
jgi:acylphosphatase